MQIPVSCPLCRPSALAPVEPERPGAWRSPRFLCEAHARDAVLPNGRRLLDVLGQPSYLDSPGLPYLLNPVKVGGFTAWVMFGAGGWRILAELGWDPFDVLACHDSYWLDALWALAVHEVCFEADGAKALLAFSNAAGPSLLERVFELARAARRRDRYRAALQAMGKPCVDSLDEADAVTIQVESQIDREGDEPFDAMVERIRALVRLAHSRFGGVAEMWAIDFECALPMAGLRARLGEHTGWSWAARDSDRLGAYTSAYHAGMMFKVYDEHGSTSDGPHYTLALARTAYCNRTRADIDAIGAELIAAVGGFDARPGSIQDWR